MSLGMCFCWVGFLGVVVVFGFVDFLVFVVFVCWSVVFVVGVLLGLGFVVVCVFRLLGCGLGVCVWCFGVFGLLGGFLYECWVFFKGNRVMK